ncbi:MAG: FoF1 ATP synthase subunit gamma [Candidatus Omnitrophota bacterium]|nr:FoF1 ATP synthase subunit gamma [Candidatus Omnitrophota bacterium]
MKILSSIKKDLEFNRGLYSLIEVLKNIAVAQYRMCEKRIKSFKELLLNIEGFLEFIDATAINHPFLNPQDKPQEIVAITSDSGLLGGLNMQVISHAILELEKKPGKLIVIGECGKMYARETNVPFVSFPGIKDEEYFAQAMQIRDYCISRILEGTYGSLKVVYPHPVVFTVQRIEVVSFLPFIPSALKPAAGEEFVPEVILESRLEDIIEYLGYLWAGEKFYEIFGLSRLAEFAARFVHLEESNQRLKEVDAKIKLEYFRARHELIDRNMRELFAARLLYAG